MLTKSAHKQRAISQLEFRKDQKLEVTIKVLEGRLEFPVSRQAYLKFQFGAEIWRSRPASCAGQHPKWNESHVVSLADDTIEVVLAEKGFLFGENEIARTTILFSDVMQGHSTEWWGFLTAKNEVAGAVLMSFELFEPDTNFTHSSNCSWDMRSLAYHDSSPGVGRTAKAQSTQINSLTPVLPKSMDFYTEPDEMLQLEKLKYDLFEESERLKAQENKVRMVYEKLKNESNRLKIEKTEIKMCTETLKIKEETILTQRAELENEKLGVFQGREEIETLRESLNLSYSRLKLEKLKMVTYRRLLEKNRGRLEKKNLQLEQQKLRMKKQLQLKLNSFE
jgi:hypothetical protein